jgi:hypothetical protein
MKIEYVEVTAVPVRATLNHLIVNIGGKKVMYTRSLRENDVTMFDLEFASSTYPSILAIIKGAPTTNRYVKVTLAPRGHEVLHPEVLLEKNRAAREELERYSEEFPIPLIETISDYPFRTVFWKLISAQISQELNGPNQPKREIAISTGSLEEIQLRVALFAWHGQAPPIAVLLEANRNHRFPYTSRSRMNEISRSVVVFEKWQNVISIIVDSASTMIGEQTYLGVAYNWLLRNLGHLETNLPEWQWEIIAKAIGVDDDN